MSTPVMTTQIKDRKSFISPEGFLVPFCSRYLHPLAIRGNHYCDFYYYQLALLVLEFPINGTYCIIFVCVKFFTHIKPLCDDGEMERQEQTKLKPGLFKCISQGIKVYTF